MNLPQLSAVEGILNALRGGELRSAEVIGPWGSGKSLLAAQVAEALGAPLLVLAPGRIEAEAIFDDLTTFCGDDATAAFPAWEVLPTDAMSPADDIVAERMNTLQRLADALAAGAPMHMVLPVRSLLQQVVSPRRLAGDRLVLKSGGEYDMEELLVRLVKLGYTREVMVENRGEVSVRGGIVDIFPISSELPFRVEFFGDEIESIRRFEPETQRSIEAVDSLQILPRSEKTLLAQLRKEPENLSSILDYFPENTLIVFDEPLAIQEEAQRLDEQLGTSPYHLPWGELGGRMASFLTLSIAQVGFDKKGDATRVHAPMLSMASWSGQAADFWEQLKLWDIEGFTVQLMCVNTGERRRLLELIEEHGYRLNQDRFDLRIGLGRLRAGFTSAQDNLAVLSEREMFGRHYVRRTRRRFEAGAAITQFSDLKSGDYIVHHEHGIGRYLGLRRFEGRAGDYMSLQYAGGDTLYVPVTHIDQVQKYSGGDGGIPKVDRLGGASWGKKKARVKKAVKDMTEDLVKLYAAREASEGFAFSTDTPWQQEFEDSFEYDETPDQARAITDVKRDMEAPRPMDRLLCGDVGYGKTEVALRAAFKAVIDGRQVAVLAPTTVLTQQHFSTFSERLADFPVTVDLLNRFRTPKEQKATIERLKSGEIDIIIGTHRLVSKDVSFKDLGLVIVDEEQRFGVGHKERLKQLRTHVDVLTLSATPIPRTLHLSMIGVRDMSVISTAPNDRLPIHTAIAEWNPDLIREAVERELNREGQVFFLHNRVQTIAKVAAFVHKLVPRARVAVAHGQMHKHELEEVMSDFIAKNVDVLICTTIIGSGIDIPNANTIIVDRADNFGLSELYQIRGRVGRYKHRAFAYLLIPGDKALSEEAQERLKALEEFSALGSGFRIAMRDLEIRGCGNILGGEQSGYIASVGYETYKDLIAEAVAEHRGEPLRTRMLPAFEVGVDAFIPENYVPTAHQKMTLYRRIAAVQSSEEIDEFLSELKDRFGAPPAPVLRLLEVMRARAMAAELGVRTLSAGKKGIQLVFQSSSVLDRRVQTNARHHLGPELTFSWQDKPSIHYSPPPDKEPVQETIHLLKVLQDSM